MSADSAERSERFYPTRPLVGVGAVVWDGKRVLLERRGQPPAQDTWALPGGLIELGETAEAAVAREVHEECGIRVQVGPVLGLFEPMERDPEGRIRFHFVVIDFLAYYAGGDLTRGDDAAEVRWADPDDLDEYRLTPAGHEMVAKAMAIVRG